MILLRARYKYNNNLSLLYLRCSQYEHSDIFYQVVATFSLVAAILHGTMSWKRAIITRICQSKQSCRTAWTKQKLLKRFVPPYACFNHISSSPCEIAFVLGYVGEVMSRRVGEGRVCALSSLAARAFSFCLADSAVPTVGRQVRHHHAQRCSHHGRNPKLRRSVLFSSVLYI